MLVQIAPIAREVSAQILDGVISRSLECLKCTDCGQKPPECELQTADCFIFAFAGGHAYGCVMDAHSSRIFGDRSRDIRIESFSGCARTHPCNSAGMTSTRRRNGENNEEGSWETGALQLGPFEVDVG